MKKSILAIIMIVFPLIASSQAKMSKVIMKNGTEIIGTIKSFDPTNAITLDVAGIETSIKMSDIARVEEEAVNRNETMAPNKPLNSKLVVTDLNEYPDSFNLDVCGTIIKMILVRGGNMNMGFDGRGSMDMNSEPIHQVSVTSFYISDTFITTLLAKQLTDKKVDTSWTYYTGKWIDVDAMTKTIAQKTGVPVRLPTEAEWEFAACSNQQSLIFSKCKNDEFCIDYFGRFNHFYEVDPTGPTSGRRHVVRYYGRGNRKFDRDHSDSKNRLRLVVKAKDVKLNL